MVQALPFVKYSGCGNDFIIIDNRKGEFLRTSFSIPQLCNRKSGIGADGILLLENSSCAAVKMRILNADGSEAEMCGNGLRCFAHYSSQIKNDRCFSIETLAGVLKVSIDGFEVTAAMPLPKDLQSPFSKIEGFHFINTGVPHLVKFVEELEILDFLDFGRTFRFHHALGNAGANVNLAKISKDKVFLRTYERGVEAETLACGTGATAAALLASLNYNQLSPIQVQMRSGETVEISFNRENDHYSSVKMKGPVSVVCKGTL